MIEYEIKKIQKGPEWDKLVTQWKKDLRIQSTAYSTAHNFNRFQFNRFQFNSIQFNSIHCNSIQNHFNPIQFNTIQFNSIQIYSMPFNNSIQFNLTQFNSIQFNSIQFNSIQFTSNQFNSIQNNSTQFNSIQFSSVQFSAINVDQIDCCRRLWAHLIKEFRFTCASYTETLKNIKGPISFKFVICWHRIKYSTVHSVLESSCHGHHLNNSQAPTRDWQILDRQFWMI